MYRIAITGASGVLGRNLLDLFVKRQGVRVLGLVRSTTRIPPSTPACAFASVDLTDSMGVAHALRAFQPTCIVHCAAMGLEFPRPAWDGLIRSNVDVTLSLCELAADFPGCHFIFVSTGLAYSPQGRPLRESDALGAVDQYGASKAAADILVRSAAAQSGVPLTVLRPFSFTGPWDDTRRLFPYLLSAADQGCPAALSPGDQVRDICSVRDVAWGVVGAVESQGHGLSGPRVYNLGSANCSPLRTLIERIVDEVGLEVELSFGARGYRPHEPMHLVADISRIQHELGWQPHHNLAHAVWVLGRQLFPKLAIREPRETM